MTNNLSDIYDVVKNLRGRAKKGYFRPGVYDFFMPIDRANLQEADEDTVTTDDGLYLTDDYGELISI